MKIVHAVLLSSLVFILVACASSQSLQPKPGATFSGELTQVKAGGNTSADSGTIEFTVTEDGLSIDSLTIMLAGDSCWNAAKSISIQGVGYTLSKNPPPPVEKAGFVWESDLVNAKGEFSTPTEAKGLIDISSKDTFTTLVCDYGTWEWIATVK